MGKQNIDVAAYVWPAYTGKELRTRIFWADGIGEWQTVKREHIKPEYNYVWNRQPLWGYQDEADPEVMEMQIEEAVSHGVNTFIYDWYWYDDRPFLENCLNDGFLKAKNNHKMKFYIMWANHDAGQTWNYDLSSSDGDYVWLGKATEAQFHTIAKRWIAQYFTRENYYMIDGKPVVSIYDLENFINGLGGIEKVKENLRWLQEEAKAAGLPGVHVQMIKWGELTLNLSGFDGGARPVTPELAKEIGFDSLTHYQMAHFADIDRDYTEIIPDMEKEWVTVTREYPVPYFPHVSIGWDNNPRFSCFRPGVVKNNTPEHFKTALQKAKAFCEEHQLSMVTINSWNEWTETSYLEPDDLYGYGYLDAVRDVFSGS